MRAVALAILLQVWLLSSQVNGLITAEAKCRSGYEWMFSSIGQSPCDIAAELGSVCPGGISNIRPLSAGEQYTGPQHPDNCLCSSVFYSLLSACSVCQGQNYIIKWSSYITNCTTPQLAVYNQDIPVGVKVPAYAYLDVSVLDGFYVALAQSTRGVESSRPPQPSSSSSTISMSTLGPFSAAAFPAQSSTSSGTTNNTPAIIGGVVGGVVAIGLIAAFIIFLMLRSKQKTQKYNSSIQLNPSIIHSMSLRPSSPGIVYNPYHDENVDPYKNDPNRPHVASNTKGNATPQTMPKTSHYTGIPEL